MGISIGMRCVKGCSPIEGKAHIPNFADVAVAGGPKHPQWLWPKAEFQTFIPISLEICIHRGGRR